MYAAACAVLNGAGTLYLVNNYSIPITVKYGLVSLTTASLITSGLIGIILAILGAVLKPKQ